MKTVTLKFETSRGFIKFDTFKSAYHSLSILYHCNASHCMFVSMLDTDQFVVTLYGYKKVNYNLSSMNPGFIKI